MAKNMAVSELAFFITIFACNNQCVPKMDPVRKIKTFRALLHSTTLPKVVHSEEVNDL